MQQELFRELTSIRQKLHAMPELSMAEHRTAAFIAERLDKMGLTVHTGIGGTGIVATLTRGDHPFCLGLRADMDALPVTESCGGRDYVSRNPGVMHACGHDGHMTILLGTAMALTRDPDFTGTVRFIFQPAEENVGGARKMIEEGLFDRFPCDAVFGLHNLPGLPVGHFSGKAGAMMASIDTARIEVLGKGGHGAQPDKTIDPILIGAQIVSSLQSVVSRNLNPATPGVVTVGSFHSGACSNIIPDDAVLEVSLRATAPGIREQMILQVENISQSTARAFGGHVRISWDPVGYPVLVNHASAFDTGCRVIASQFGTDRFETLSSPLMISEDFSFMLEQVPGAFFFIGNGDSSPLHSASYDFNDAAIPHGVCFLTNLVKTRCPEK